MECVLAIDIGASGGCHILGRRDGGGGIIMEEVYRFENAAVRRGGTLCWDTDGLFGHVIAGMKRCAELGKIPAAVGVDTWGVDFVLLGDGGEPAGDAVAYRDGRTGGMDAAVHSLIPEQELYARTGVQKEIFNTVYQLMALKTGSPEVLEKARTLLFMPDWLHYKLSGVKICEYTIATTSGLVNAATKDWDDEVIGRCGYPSGLFQQLSPPGTVLGRLAESVREQVGFDCAVILPPSHDTASAFFSVPQGNNLTLSSGTWSLMGVQTPRPILTQEARELGFSNEGGAEGQFCLLKNIMGLWMIQSVRRELPERRSYAELEQMARKSGYQGLVDVNDAVFFAPRSMTEAVKCAALGHPPPKTLGDTLRCIYRSLARSYAQTAGELETLTGRRFDGIHIVGGGGKDAFLNELTAGECGLPLHVGPSEGTAMGNILCQLGAVERG